MNVGKTITFTKSNGVEIIFSKNAKLAEKERLNKLVLNAEDSVLALMQDVYDAKGENGEDISQLFSLVNHGNANVSDFKSQKEQLYGALIAGDISVYRPLKSTQSNSNGLFDHWVESAEVKQNSGSQNSNNKASSNSTDNATNRNATNRNNTASTNSSTSSSGGQATSLPAVSSQSSGTNAVGKASAPIDETPKNGCPISMITGEELLEHVDVSIPAPIALNWKRIYRSSQSHLDCGLGFGWRSPYDIELIEKDDQVTFVNEEGRRIDFVTPQLKQRSYQLTEALVLYRYDANEYLISLPGNQHWSFKKLNGRWKPVQLKDEFGNHLYLRYNEKYQLRRVDASNQRCLIVDRDNAGHVLRITPGKWDKFSEKVNNLSQALVRYQYDEQGDLIAAIDAENGSEHYQYQHHLFTSRTLKSGYNYHFEWDSNTPEARCTRQWGDDDIYSYQFSYDDKNRTTYSTDGRGGKEIFVYNTNGRLIDYIDACGHRTRYEYDQFNRLCSVTNPLGQTEQYQYDAKGRLVETIDVAGNQRFIQYNLQNNPVQYTDATGANWCRNYDLFGRLTETINPLGQSTRYHYQRDGKLKKIQYADGSQEFLDWNNSGELQHRINNRGKKTQYQYTDLGQISQVLLPDNRVVHYAYNPSGSLAGIARYFIPLGNEGETGDIPEQNEQWLFNYDKAGRLIKHTAPGDLITRWKYQGLAQVTRRINPDGTTLDYQYDKERNLTGLTNENGEQYQLAYNANEQLIREIGFDGREQNYQYDPLGHLTEIRDGIQRKQSFKRDPLGQLKEKISFHNELAESDLSVYNYDAEGRLIRANNSARKLKFEYDLAGNLISEWQDKSQTQHSYDTAGRRIKSQLPEGEAVDYQLTAQGHVERILYNGQALAQFERDQLGRELARSLGNGLYAEQSFNPLGKIQQQKLYKTGDRTLIQRGYLYNACGNIEKISELSGDTNFFYDQTDQLSHVEGLINAQFKFDPAGNIVDLAKPKTSEQTIQPEEMTVAEDLNQQSGLEHSKQSISPTRGETDKSNLIKSQVAGNRLKQFQDCQYEYDDCGNLIKIKQGEVQPEVTTLVYNGANQLIRSRKNKVTTEYQYDALGRRVSKNSGTGVTTFLWNGDVLLSEQKDFNRTVYLFEPNSFTPLVQITNGEVNYLHNDHLNTPIAMSDEQGELNWSVKYQPYGKIDRVEIQAVNCNLRFQGQYFDVETGLHYNRFRYYDPNNGRFTSQDPIGLSGGLNAYRYAPNPIGWVDPLGLKCKEGDSTPESSEMAPSAFARSLQGVGEYPGTDVYRDITLKKGEVIYGGTPGQSEFYTTASALKRCDYSSEKLFNGLQVAPGDPSHIPVHIETGLYRPGVTAYELVDDIPAAFGRTLANPQLGSGGLPQIVIENYKDYLKPLYSIPLKK